MKEIRTTSKFSRSSGKASWVNTHHKIAARRYGPAPDNGYLSYSIALRGGWTTIAPHEIQPLIRILTQLQADAEGRMK